MTWGKVNDEKKHFQVNYPFNKATMADFDILLWGGVVYYFLVLVERSTARKSSRTTFPPCALKKHRVAPTACHTVLRIWGQCGQVFASGLTELILNRIHQRDSTLNLLKSRAQQFDKVHCLSAFRWDGMRVVYFSACVCVCTCTFCRVKILLSVSLSPTWRL